MLLVGSLTLVTATLFGAWRDGSLALVRSGFRAMLLGVIPSFLLMRLTAEWIASKEGLEDADITWINIGFTTSDFGLLLIVVATVAAGLSVRRASRSDGATGVGARVATVLFGLLARRLSGHDLGDDDEAELSVGWRRADGARSRLRPLPRPGDDDDVRQPRLDRAADAGRLPGRFRLRAGAAGGGGGRDGRRLRAGLGPPGPGQPAHRARGRQRDGRDLQRPGQPFAAGDHRRPAGPGPDDPAGQPDQP